MEIQPRERPHLWTGLWMGRMLAAQQRESGQSGRSHHPGTLVTLPDPNPTVTFTFSGTGMDAELPGELQWSLHHYRLMSTLGPDARPGKKVQCNIGKKSLLGESPGVEESLSKLEKCQRGLNCESCKPRFLGFLLLLRV